VRKLVAAGILEPCVSANASRNVFVTKKDFGLRCTGDFRGLNAQTVPDRYPSEDPKRHVEWFASKQYFCLRRPEGWVLLDWSRQGESTLDGGAHVPRVVSVHADGTRG
jgi:hypothetical protein